ncbi:hypothetical protein D3C85_1421100 [compost metagenome]
MGGVFTGSLPIRLSANATCNGYSVRTSPSALLLTVVPAASLMRAVRTASSRWVGTMNGECVV